MIPKELRSHEWDDRVRRYLLPRRVLHTAGAVENAEVLLLPRPRQVQLQETSYMTLTAAPETPASVLLDFGAEFHGGAVITVFSVKPGDEARLRVCFGESAAEAMSVLGEKGACNDHSPRDYSIPVKPYSVNETGATGYRFLRLELTGEASVTVAAVQGVMVYHDYAYQGSFHCSDPLLDRIYNTAAYTCHLCLQDQLWDGIKRDRLVWIGDLYPEMMTARYVFGEVPQIYEALRLAAKDAPPPKWTNLMATYAFWWLILLREWSDWTGREEFLTEQADYVRALTRHILAHIDETGRFTPCHFVDWPSCGKPAAIAGTKALTRMGMRAAAILCDRLNEPELAAQCRAVTDRLGQCREDAGGMKQIAALLLREGMADEAAAETLRRGGGAGFSTFMSYFILKAMADCCSPEETLDALREYYGGMLALGATTFWEDFDPAWAENAAPLDALPDGEHSDVHGDNGAFCYKGFRHSLCHGWASGPVPFLTEYVLGLEIPEGQNRVIRLDPHLGDLTFAEGSFATPFGKVSVRHEKQTDGTVTTAVTAPPEITVLYK